MYESVYLFALESLWCAQRGVRNAKHRIVLYTGKVLARGVGGGVQITRTARMLLPLLLNEN